MSKELLTDIFSVQDDRPVWYSNYRQKFIDFCKQHSGNGKEYVCEVREVTNHCEYFQHKFYRGYLLPALAKESYDGLAVKAHFAMKELFLKQEVKGWENIPKKFRGGCIPLLRDVQKVETGEIEQEVYAYLPSTADLTRGDFEEYIQNILRLIEDMGLQVSFGANGEECYRQGFMLDEEAV